MYNCGKKCLSAIIQCFACPAGIAVIFYITSFLVRTDIELSENVYVLKVNLGKTFFINKLKFDGPLF